RKPSLSLSPLVQSASALAAPPFDLASSVNSALLSLPSLFLSPVLKAAISSGGGPAGMGGAAVTTCVDCLLPASSAARNSASCRRPSLFAPACGKTASTLSPKP